MLRFDARLLPRGVALLLEIGALLNLLLERGHALPNRGRVGNVWLTLQKTPIRIDRAHEISLSLVRARDVEEDHRLLLESVRLREKARGVAEASLGVGLTSIAIERERRLVRRERLRRFRASRQREDHATDERASLPTHPTGRYHLKVPFANMAAVSSQLTSVGRYQVLGELAIGGMAEILLARLVGPAGFERPVVIKRILPHLARQKSFVDMFVEEARIAASIRHHNVVHVQELVHDGSDLFLVMEYLEGESLAGLERRLLVREEELDPWLGAHVVAEACAGLHAAHEMANLVHRDVSPQNVFVTYDGQIKILDFGIAKIGDGGARTETGQLKGKFAYMSPEQCRSERLDRRSDIFALGIVLYELTTRARLFKGPSPVDIIRAICSDSVLPPSRLIEGYPISLERVCMRALAFDRDDRYATAADMRRDLLEAVGARAALDEALSSLMRAAFADRIAEKEEMLRRVRSGMPITHVPAGEADSNVEVPAAPRADVDVASDRRRPRRAALALAGVGLAVAAGAAYVSLTHAARPLASTPSAVAAVEGTTSASASPSAAEVQVHVESRPPGAAVTFDGKPRGQTPVDLRVARGAAPITLELRHGGYATVEQTITPDADQKVLLDLPRAVRSAPRASSSSSPWARWN
ncbi:MAG TPA: serine/threonine-protein kinase [Polyangiaceae bacterium]